MCFTQRDQNLEEEVRRLRMEEESRRKREERARSEQDHAEKKPVTEKVKEMVGAR